ncbi:drug/metabolite transporter (DMT)-like permease [Pelomonas saccharophila]|uniref:Drug/metabolite transporter (DMT)-like permease n=1 Tax=Roseateles saccharophilus TaxID=304 RepID=A0ABU1YRD2_ROSSA|nr:DMT family transporter [Roseateles saccharophilus]MDR7271409.1 drug/metabolite transporter (DMT)-like permease [Roseateles saccharophilus]
MKTTERKADLLALGAIAMWASLAALGVSLAHVPPFLLTGLGLLVGSALALPLSRFKLSAWQVPLPTLALGVYGLFGFHLLLFVALRTAPALQANLINYLWPLGMVVLAPLLLPGLRWRAAQIGAALLGFAGAAVLILGRGGPGGALDGGWHPGYALALGSALVWSTYSLATRRVPAFPTCAVGSFAAVSGLLSLGCHALWEPAVALNARDLALIAALGLGPLGGAFFLWDAALKAGDPRRIGLLAFLTPLLSTAVVMATTGQALSASLILGGLMIVGAAIWGSREPAA